MVSLKRVVAAWVTLGLAVALLARLATAQLPAARMLDAAIFDFAHFPSAGLLSLAVLFLLREASLTRTLSPLTRYWMAGVSAGLITSVIELSQLFTDRSPSLHDLMLNWAGAATFMLMTWICVGISLSSKKKALTLPRLSAILLVIAITTVAARPTLSLAWAYHQRDAVYPILADFEASWQLFFIEENRSRFELVPTPTAWRENSSHNVAKITLEKNADWPGVSIREPHSDWRNQTHFSLQIFNPASTPATIGVRIDDRHHDGEHADRYNGNFSLLPGHNQLRIPVADIRSGPRNRNIDLSEIWRIVIFSPGDTAPEFFFLDNLVLTSE